MSSAQVRMQTVILLWWPKSALFKWSEWQKYVTSSRGISVTHCTKSSFRSMVFLSLPSLPKKVMLLSV